MVGDNQLSGIWWQTTNQQVMANNKPAIAGKQMKMVIDDKQQNGNFRQQTNLPLVSNNKSVIQGHTKNWHLVTNNKTAI